ncbi:LysR substrate-binding domain-containing protein, partial [Gammaproteobacteria bacterium]|nr:LysR substrate-binding domain-containing protein [Gammaproteobacteria bacterium]
RTTIDRAPGWADWFRAASAPMSALPNGPFYQDPSEAMQAAIDGQGIALARSGLVIDDIEKGRLIRLFDVDLPSFVNYHALISPQSRETTAARRFVDWLHLEAELTQAKCDLHAEQSMTETDTIDAEASLWRRQNY